MITKMTIITIDVHDPRHAFQADFTKYVFAETRLAAKEAFKKQSGDFNEVTSYELYDVRDENFVYIHIHTSPVRISSKIERRKLYVRRCSYDDLSDDAIAIKQNVDNHFMIANYSSGETKVVDFSNEFRRNNTVHEDRLGRTASGGPKVLNPSERTLEEVIQLEHECRPMRLQPVLKLNLERKHKMNMVRKVVREIIPNSSSSSDEQSDTKKSKKSSDIEEDQKPTKKQSGKKSKHQGKAKTFKRKTQRRGRV